MEGDFRLLGPVDLLLLLAQGGKTGVFQVEEGEVYLEGGRPVHARHRDRVGREALRGILALKEGSFRFTLGVRAPLSSLEAPLEVYLLEVLEVLEEGVRLGPFDRVHVEAPTATLPPEDQALLQALPPGGSPVDLFLQGFPLEEVLKRLGRLARLRLLRVEPRLPRPLALRVQLGHKGVQAQALLVEAWRGLAPGPPGRARVRVQGEGREALLEVEGVKGLGPGLYLSPEHLLFHGFRVGEEVWVWPEP